MGTDLTASWVINRLIATDYLVAMDRLRTQQSQIYREIGRLNTSAQSLWPAHYSIFLSGSRALALRSDDQKLLRRDDGRSDVDIWVIIESEAASEIQPDTTISQRAGYLSQYGMVATPWQASLPFSIKLVGAEVAERTFTLTNQAPTVLRTASLVARKPIDRFYGCHGVYEHITREEVVAEGYRWTWESEVFAHDDLVLTDLLGFVITGGFLVDHLGLATRRGKLMRELVTAIVAHEAAPDSDTSEFFGYLKVRFGEAFSKLAQA